MQVGVELWLSLKAFLERDIDGLGLVEVGSYDLYLRVLDLLNGVRSHQRQQKGKGGYEEEETRAHWIREYIKREKL